MVGFFPFRSKVEFTASLNRTGFCIGHELVSQATPFNLPEKEGLVTSSRRVRPRVGTELYTLQDSGTRGYQTLFLWEIAKGVACETSHELRELLNHAQTALLGWSQNTTKTSNHKESDLSV